MNNPQEIMARIRRSRRQTSPPSRAGTPVPAPAPMTPPSGQPARSTPAPVAFATSFPAASAPPTPTTPAPAAFAARPPQAAVPVPPPAEEAPAGPGSAPGGDRPRLVSRPVGGHALYSELMRSHDRMGTRHIASAPPTEPPRGEG